MIKSETKVINFIDKSNKIHNGKYKYDKVKYINNKTKVIITCQRHGDFTQIPMTHLKGSGCPYCYNEKRGQIKKLSLDEIIGRSKKIHGDKFNYKNSIIIKNKISVECPLHGYFEQRIFDHIKGHGCPKCGGVGRIDRENFIEKSNKIHNNKYDYSLVNFKNTESKISIICPNHGNFQQKVRYHLKGKGCPICKTSKGERTIINYLENKKIKFIYQHIFNDCKDKSFLKFDFYLPEYDMCIEYDGRQHYESVWENINVIKNRDKIKNDYCLKNNIRLIRISYKENLTESLMLLFP